jgi:leucyl-tRNA synthetase
VQGYLDNPKDVKSIEITKLQHKTIKKVTDDLNRLGFNTAVAALMEYLNGLSKLGSNKEALVTLLKLLAPFAPHMSSELLHELGEDKVDWPKFDEKFTQDALVKIGVQVNGKLRGEIEVSADTTEAEALDLAKKNANAAIYLRDTTPKKVIYVPGRILNIIV